jgi:hypothetical protein
MSKRSPRTTKRERRARLAGPGAATVHRDCNGRRVLVVVDEAAAFEECARVHGPDAAALLLGYFVAPADESTVPATVGREHD